MRPGQASTAAEVACKVACRNKHWDYSGVNELLDLNGTGFVQKKNYSTNTC